MPHSCGSRFRRGIPVEFVEADVETGFSLVDLAEAEFDLGDTHSASRALQDAEDVFRDIQQRLLRMGTLESGPFGPLICELRRAIDQAKLHTAQT
jgi:hypothetical protein